MPQTWVFLPKQTMSGIMPICWKAHIVPVSPIPVWTSSKMSRASFSSASFRRACRNSGRKWLSPPSPWIGSMMMAAMSSGLSAKRALDLRDRLALGRLGVLEVLALEREADRRVQDARPVELREVLRLARVERVGQDSV